MTPILSLRRPRVRPSSDPVGEPALQGEELDEARARVLAELAPGLVEGGQRAVIERVRRGAGYRSDRASIELDRDLTGDVAVDGIHERVQVLAQRLLPEPRIAEVGPFAVEIPLEVVLMDRADELLELAVAAEYDRGGGNLVDVADLEPDHAILDLIDDADPVAAAQLPRPLQQLDQTEALAVQGDRTPGLEAEPDQLGLLWRALGPDDELEDVLGGGLVEVLDLTTLRGAAPEVVVDRIGGRLGATFDGDAALAGIRDLLLTPHLPLPHRRDHLQLGIERGDRRLQPHLVVSLAGAAVGNRVASVLASCVDRELRDQRPPQRGEEGIAAAVKRVRLDRGEHVGLGELLAGIDHERL